MRRCLILALALCAAAGCKKKDPAGAPAPAASLPGAPAMPPEVAERLAAALRARGDDHVPRTRHLRPDGSPRYTNRLLLEASPYLQQHAHNPVNWYPWGEEAFAAARRLDRPIFLSIGYSTCHWCHVMEEESFEDEEIARTLNEHYIAIKVDREERPDVDSIYMSAVRAMGQSGGWPLNVWLTPDKQPFFGGTYFPPRDGDRGASVGFLTILERARASFDDDREALVATSSKVAERIAAMSAPPDPGERLPGPELLHAAAAAYQERFDGTSGGLRVPRGGSKFPSSLPVRFLLRYHRRTGDRAFLDMAVLTLDRMAAGGLFDQIGGGFHRYATDARWLVPHFEKMLYDNALLATVYLEAYQATGDERHARIAREVLDYLAREMRAPEGGFYSATDADSLTPTGEREEGYYFTWTPAEIRDALEDERTAELVLDAFAVGEAGNFEGRSVLSRPRALAEVARAHELSPEEAAARLAEARETLRAVRARRPAPHRDEKILTAWNGLAVGAFARAGRVLGDERYLRIAGEGARFVLGTLRVDGRLRRSFAGGSARLTGYLEDYAFTIAGLLDLFEATSEPRWLAEARALDRVLEARYEDPRGGFFRTADDAEALLVREKPLDDGALPSGNSVQALNLLRLHELTSDSRYLARADRTLRAFAPVVERSPVAMSELLLALDWRHDTARQVVIVAAPEEDAAQLEAVLTRTFAPNAVAVTVAPGRDPEALAAEVPLVAGKVPLRGASTAYVCEQQRCELPTTDPEVFARQLAAAAPLPEPAARER